MIYEADEVIDKMLEKKVNEMDITFNIAVINVLFEIVGSKRFDPNSTGQKFQKEIVVSSILHKKTKRNPNFCLSKWLDKKMQFSILNCPYLV